MVVPASLGVRPVSRLALLVGTCALLPTFVSAQMVSSVDRLAWVPTPGAYVQEYAPPDGYRTWYREMEACSGQHGPVFDSIRFFAVDAPTFMMQGYRVVGWGDAHSRTVWVTTRDLFERRIVAHELLHIILGPGHPVVPWKMPCQV